MLYLVSPVLSTITPAPLLPACHAIWNSSIRGAQGYDTVLVDGPAAWYWPQLTDAVNPGSRAYLSFQAAAAAVTWKCLTQRRELVFRFVSRAREHCTVLSRLSVNRLIVTQLPTIAFEVYPICLSAVLPLRSMDILLNNI
jgi:hypothetical protein